MSKPRERERSARQGAAKGRNAEPARLGFAVKVLGADGLKSHDTRRWQQRPDLRVSLEYVRRVFDYLAETDIHMYRLSSDIAPYATHPDMPQFHGQVAECAGELRALGRRARELKLRLSFHPSQFIVLNSPDPDLVAKSIWDVASQTEMLDRMELGPEAVLVLHVGGAYGDRDLGCRRWCETYRTLSADIRRRLVLENDDGRYSAADVLKIHGQTGVPLVFDHQHFCCWNPEQLDLRATASKFLKTWPAAVRPKLHFSSPRTELRLLKRKVRGSRKKKQLLQPPVWTGHADYINPFEFIGFMRALAGVQFDVMLEAKAKDLALTRLRRDLQRYAPDVATKFGLETPGEMPDEPAVIEVSQLDGSTRTS